MRTFLLLILSIMGACTACAQSTFNLTYDNPYLSTGYSLTASVNEIEDFYYVHGILIDADAFNVGLLLKFDSTGLLVDSVIYDGVSDAHHAYIGEKDKVVFNEDHFYFVLREEKSLQDLSENLSSLVKTDLDGEIIWKKDIDVDTTGYQRNIYRGCSAHQEGFLCYGIVTDTLGVLSFSQVKGLLSRTDAEGNLLWHRRYEGVLETQHVEVLADGGILISGRQNLALGGGTGSDIILIRTDSLGIEQWRYVFEGPEDGVTHHEDNAPICILEDGTIAAITRNEGLPDFTVFNGPWWIKRIEDLGDDYAVIDDFYLHLANTQKLTHDMIRLSNGNVAMVGSDFQYLAPPVSPQAGYYAEYGVLLMLSADLDSLYTRYYEHFNHFLGGAMPQERLYDIEECEDGGLALCGYATRGSNDTLPYLTHAWVLKTDSLGCIEPGCQVISGLREQIIGLQESMTLFPNPLHINDPLNIQFEPLLGGQMPYSNQETRLVIYDLAGKLVYQEELPPTGSNSAFIHQLKVPTLEAGLYTVHWLSSDMQWFDSVPVVVE